METLLIIGILIEIAFLLFAARSLKFIVHVWNENRNPMDYAVFLIIMALTFQNTYSSIRRLFQLPAYKFFEIEIGNILYVIIAVIVMWFVLFIYERDEFYSLPFVMGFFVLVQLHFLGDETLTINFIIFSVLTSGVILARNAVVNKNGMSFSITLTGILGIADYFLEILVFTYIVRFAILVIFIMGINGYWDEKIFYDRVQRKKIQNTWISTLVS